MLSLRQLLGPLALVRSTVVLVIVVMALTRFAFVEALAVHQSPHVSGLALQVRDVVLLVLIIELVDSVLVPGVNVLVGANVVVELLHRVRVVLLVLFAVLDLL